MSVTWSVYCSVLSSLTWWQVIETPELSTVRGSDATCGGTAGKLSMKRNEDR